MSISHPYQGMVPCIQNMHLFYGLMSWSIEMMTDIYLKHQRPVNCSGVMQHTSENVKDQFTTGKLIPCSSNSSILLIIPWNITYHPYLYRAALPNINLVQQIWIQTFWQWHMWTVFIEVRLFFKLQSQFCQIYSKVICSFDASWYQQTW